MKIKHHDINDYKDVSHGFLIKRGCIEFEIEGRTQEMEFKYRFYEIGTPEYPMGSHYFSESYVATYKGCEFQRCKRIFTKEFANRRGIDQVDLIWGQRYEKNYQDTSTFDYMDVSKDKFKELENVYQRVCREEKLRRICR